MKSIAVKFRAKLQLIIIVLFAAILMNGVAFAQSSFKVDNSSKMVIAGTSTLHDWESEVTNYSGKAIMEVGSQNIDAIKSMMLEIPVEAIKSEHSGMDSKTYDALKKKQYPTIKFDLTKVEKIAQNEVSASGKLTIAGYTRDVNMTVHYQELGNSKVVFKGEKNIKMTDFNVVPPTALMGTIKSGDEVTVKFETVFVK